MSTPAKGRLLPLVPATRFLTAAERRERSLARIAWLREGQETKSELPGRVADWPEEWRKRLKECSFTIEFEGGLHQEEADRQAEIRVRTEYARSLATPMGSPSETVFAEAVSLSQVRGQGEARTGGPAKEPGDPDGELAPSGS